MSSGRAGPKPRTIRRILLVVLLAAIVPGMLVQALLHLQRFNTEQAREMQTHVDVARAVAVAFQASIEDVAQEVYAVGLAILRFTPDNHRAASRFLSATLQRHPAVVEFAWLSPEGRVIAASNSSAVGQDRHSEEYLVGLGSDRPWVLGPVQSDRQTGTATFTVAYLLDDEEGRPRGVLTASMDAEQFADTRLKIHRTPDAGFILIDNKGIAAFRRPYFPFPQWQWRDFSKEEFVSAALAGREASGILFLAMTGNSWFTACTPVHGLAWVASAGREYDTVMAPLWRDLGLGVGLSLLCLLVSGGIAFYYGRMILTDLRGLHNSVMAWGKFQKPAAQSPVKSIAELQNIALAFETVTRQRMEAEQALRESEDRFRKVFENAATGIAITNWDGRFQQCNPTFCALLGYTAEELRRIEVASIIHPEDRDTHLAEIRRLQAGELQFFQIENRLVRKDGQPVWVHKFASVLPDAMGKPAHLVALVTDITERKRAEEELRQSRKDLDRAQEVGQIGSWRLDVRRNVLKWSDETYRIFGVPQGTPLTYESFMAIVHPDDRRYVDMQWKAGLDGEPYDVEHRIVVSDQTKWVREKAYLEFDDAGHLIGGFGIAQDITERKRAEEALRDSEEKFRSAFANAAIGFAMTTPDGSFVDANPAYCAITGYGIEELRTLAFQQLIHPDDFAENMRLFDRMLAGQIADFVVENRYFRKGGGAVWVRKSVSLVRNAVSAPQWIIVLVEDVTERKQTEEMLRQLNETLEQRVSERTQLAEARARQLQALAMELLEAEERERRRVAELLHDDLQQILAAARMQLQAACENLPSEPLLTNVEQLLEQSISRSRRLSHELSPTVLHHSSLVAALQWLAQQMRNQFGLQVQLVSNEAQRFENAPLKVFVFRAVQELLFNVVKHAGVKSVRLSLSGSVRSLVLTVSDLGQGFSPDVLDSAAETGGFGLLSLRERARYFGGSLAIESAPGKGSCFTLTLPIRLERTGESERLEVHRQPLTQAGATVSVVSGRIRLLLVDDHQVMRQGLRKLIAGQPDIEVAGEASNGREAIEQVRQLKPDVVVMDVSMPVMDGIEATRCIKAEMPEVRVIGLSMYEEEHIARSMREAGTEAFVRKTAPSAELLKAIYGVDRD